MFHYGYGPYADLGVVDPYLGLAQNFEFDGSIIDYLIEDTPNYFEFNRTYQEITSDVSIPTLNELDIRIAGSISFPTESFPDWASRTLIRFGDGSDADDKGISLSVYDDVMGFSLYDGSGASTGYFSAAVSFTIDQLYVWRVIWNSSTGDFSFYYKTTTASTILEDTQLNSGWTLVSSHTGSTVPRSAVEPLTWCFSRNTSWPFYSYPFGGKVYYGQISGTIDGTPFAALEPTLASLTSKTWESSLGETLTMRELISGYIENFDVRENVVSDDPPLEWAEYWSLVKSEIASGSWVNEWEDDQYYENEDISILFPSLPACITHVFDFEANEYRTYLNGTLSYTAAITGSIGAILDDNMKIISELTCYMQDYTTGPRVAGEWWGGTRGCAFTRSVDDIDDWVAFFTQ